MVAAIASAPATSVCTETLPAAPPAAMCTWLALEAQPASRKSRMIALTRAILRRSAGAPKAISHGRPLGRLGRRLDQDALAAGAVELAQRGVQALCVRLRLARHAQPIVDALVGPREGEHRDFRLELGDRLVETVRRDQSRRRARRVVALEPARMPWRGGGLIQDFFAEDFSDLLARNMPGPQQRRRGARKIDDSGLDAHFARPAFEHEVDVLAQILAHVRRGRRRDTAEAVRRW